MTSIMIVLEFCSHTNKAFDRDLSSEQYSASVVYYFVYQLQRNLMEEMINYSKSFQYSRTPLIIYF